MPCLRLITLTPALLFIHLSGECSGADSGISWRFGGGLSYRATGVIRFNTGSISAATSLPLLVSPSSVSNPFGPETGFADRTYNDGFVFQDTNTANPGALLPGTTAFWGYNSSTQVVGDNLVFNGAGTSSVFSQMLAGALSAGWSDYEWSPSPSLDITAMIDLGKGWHLGASLGFTTFHTGVGGSSSNFRATQQSQAFTHTVTDTYALQGVVPPGAPYAGVFNPPGPAPVIDNVPTSRVLTSTLTATQSGVFTNSIEESLELNFYVLSLGPVIEFQHDRWVLGGSLGFAMNLVDWRATFKEELTGVSGAGVIPAGRWEAESSDLDVLGGFYLQWQAAYAITPRLHWSVFGRHDWMSSLSASVGPSSYKAVLDGFTFGTAVQFRF